MNEIANNTVLTAFLDYISSLQVGESIEISSNRFVVKTKRGFKILDEITDEEIVKYVKYAVKSSGYAKIEIDDNKTRSGRATRK